MTSNQYWVTWPETHAYMRQPLWGLNLLSNHTKSKKMATISNYSDQWQESLRENKEAKSSLTEVRVQRQRQVTLAHQNIFAIRSIWMMYWFAGRLWGEPDSCACSTNCWLNQHIQERVSDGCKKPFHSPEIIKQIKSFVDQNSCAKIVWAAKDGQLRSLRKKKPTPKGNKIGMQRASRAGGTLSGGRALTTILHVQTMDNTN